MGVKSSDEITLGFIVDIVDTVTYYKLQEASLDPPDAPIAATPTGWSETEPEYDGETEKKLYSVTKTTFTDGTFSYSEVSLSSSFKAANQALVQALTANDNATSAMTQALQASANSETAIAKVEAIQIGGTNLVLQSKDFTEAPEFWRLSRAASNASVSYDENGFGILTFERHNTGWLGQRFVSYPHPYILREEMHRGITVSFDFMCDSYAELTDPKICCIRYHYDTQVPSGYYSGYTDGPAYSVGEEIQFDTSAADGVWLRASFYLAPDDLMNHPSPTTGAPVRYVSLNFMLSGDGVIHFRKVQMEYGNTATAWSPSPADAEYAVSQAAKVATNFLAFEDGSGLIVGDMTEDTLGANTLISANGVSIRNGETELATFSESLIEIGKSSGDATIDFRNGNFTMSNFGVNGDTVHGTELASKQAFFVSVPDDRSYFGDREESIGSVLVAGDYPFEYDAMGENPDDPIPGEGEILLPGIPPMGVRGNVEQHFATFVAQDKIPDPNTPEGTPIEDGQFINLRAGIEARTMFKQHMNWLGEWLEKYTHYSELEIFADQYKIANPAKFREALGIDTSGNVVNRNFPEFTYSGNYQIVDDDDGNWRIKFLTSGTLVFTKLNGASRGIDIFLVGGGGAGCTNGSSYPCGQGGGGGYTFTEMNVLIPNIGEEYEIVVGAGGTAISTRSSSTDGASGGVTTAFNRHANGGQGGIHGSGGRGGNGGSGGAASNYTDPPDIAGSDGSDATHQGTGVSRVGTGQGRTTREFGESTGALYSGGGGGTADGKGGAGGGGDAGGDKGEAGWPNTGGGGGGGRYYQSNGGSGIVIIRNRRS